MSGSQTDTSKAQKEDQWEVDHGQDDKEEKEEKHTQDRLNRRP